MKPVLLILIFTPLLFATEWKLPIQCENQTSFRDMRLTRIGHFGMLRVARPTVPAHLHTAIDICRPDSNYENAEIFPARSGKVISMRNDGPYAQIIISHSDTVWSVYEHIAGITVKAGEFVTTETPIARFMNSRELNAYGWHFNHVHFELMKKRPEPRDTLPGQPDLHYGTYALTCYDDEDLNEHYHNPLLFFREKWKEEKK